MTEASKIIGNMELKAKFEEAQKGLKRGIVFAASLYLWWDWTGPVINDYGNDDAIYYLT